MPRNQYFLTYPVDKGEADAIQYAILGSNELDIIIGSVGGSVNEGFRIINMMQAAEKSGKAINTHIISNADSIASAIFLAPTKKENRHIVESSTLFIHEPRFSMGFDITQSDAQKMDEELELQKNRIADFYVKQIEGLTKDEALSLMNGETNLSATKMLELGIVGEVKPVLDIAAKREMNNIYNQSYSKMGLFGNKKVVVNQVVSGDNTFLHEGELAVDSELTQVGQAEAKLEGEHVIADGRTLVVSAENKVSEIKPKVEASTGDDQITAIAQMMNDMETSLIAKMDAKIEAIRKGTNGHKPPKKDGSSTDAIQTGDQATARKEMKTFADTIQAKRTALRDAK